ncbi:uncharacterized protein LOC111049319 [Nilaparvata lugens]|uniref:uncharacterized protein LOC111049319 n=1 Tax=Nilaparvata lugens TaxID=108931 RepID=UPI00193EB156|nr:uncharacterized protein LOC111049319 [Nilaparvata lugens]
MSRKTQSAYEGVLSYLKEHTPELNPTVVMSDFEQAMQNAARMVWPNTRIVGCFFHYAQESLPWPADQAEAEQLSQRQMAYLARVAVNADDAVAGEGDLVCVACAVHKRSYMTQPCAHFVLCGTCVLVHRRTVNYRGVLPQPIICPVCRSPLTGYCRVFQ